MKKNGSVDVTFTRAITHQKHLAQSGRSTRSAVDIFNTLRVLTKKPIREQEIKLECMNIHQIIFTHIVLVRNTDFLNLTEMKGNIWILGVSVRSRNVPQILWWEIPDVNVILLWSWLALIRGFGANWDPNNCNLSSECVIFIYWDLSNIKPPASKASKSNDVWW